jgi:hypothetical protein
MRKCFWFFFSDMAPLPLSLFQFNVGGLSHFTGEVLSMATSHDLVFVQETHVPVLPSSFPAYHVFQNPVYPNAAGHDSAGTAVLVSKSLPFVPKHYEFANPVLDVCWVRMEPKDPSLRAVLLGSSYFFPMLSCRKNPEAPFELLSCLALYR